MVSALKSLCFPFAYDVATDMLTVTKSSPVENLIWIDLNLLKALIEGLISNFTTQDYGFSVPKKYSIVVHILKIILLLSLSQYVNLTSGLVPNAQHNKQ